MKQINQTAKTMGATVTCIDENQEAREFYYKLHRCLKRAMSDEKLCCHVNNIIVQLGKSIESQYTYYDASFDAWCDYFLE